MREGMKKLDSKHIKWIPLITALLLMLVLSDICIVKILYDNYCDKIQIICKMMEEDNTLEAATNILKTDIYKDTKTGQKILEQYGYHRNDKNALYDKFQLQYRIVISISVMVALVLLICCFILRKIEKEKVRNDMELIEKLLAEYKRGIVNHNSNQAFHYEVFQELNDEICSLGDTLKLMNEREIQEKESTKSLVSDISHQLKTPVAALKTSFEILQQDLSPEERMEFTQRCNIQILGIENLLDALINISRLEAQSIFDTILESINRVYEKAEHKNIQIELEANEDLKEIWIPHDKKWLCEAFINLLENAIKYSPVNSHIIINMLKMVSFLRIEICDEGIGIPKEDYNQIFKRFYRGNSSVVKQQPGSGIGLYLTREIIGRHHGTIRVEAGKCKTGSRFIIQLPFQ
jgi:Signal transduction histidine kinase